MLRTTRVMSVLAVFFFFLITSAVYFSCNCSSSRVSHCKYTYMSIDSCAEMVRYKVKCVSSMRLLLVRRVYCTINLFIDALLKCAALVDSFLMCVFVSPLDVDAFLLL